MTNSGVHPIWAGVASFGTVVSLQIGYNAGVLQAQICDNEASLNYQTKVEITGTDESVRAWLDKGILYFAYPAQRVAGWPL